jgi:hypothetical protein
MRRAGRGQGAARRAANFRTGAGPGPRRWGCSHATLYRWIAAGLPRPVRLARGAEVGCRHVKLFESSSADRGDLFVRSRGQ